jgi:SMP-30/Gluconolactonase/LRE-like region
MIMSTVEARPVSVAETRVLVFIFALLAWLCLAAPPANATDLSSGAKSCSPVAELSFVCGIANPEDIVIVPGSGKMIVSSMEAGSRDGLYLVDAERKSFEPVRLLAPKPDPKYKTCAGPPPPNSIIGHGLSLRSTAPDRFTLYVVNHGGRETIEVFNVSALSPGEMTWIGCVSLPEGEAANSVTSLPDGTLLATIAVRRGTTGEEGMSGQNTGVVLKWTPGSAGFVELKGTEMPIDNGIEASADGKTFYVSATGLWSVYAFSLNDTSKPLWSVKFDNMAPDNLRWTAEGRLLATGMKQNEPQCGGPMRPVNGKFVTCNRGYIVAEVDPELKTWRVAAEGPVNPAFSGMASAVINGDTIWIASFGGDRLAYRPIR